MIDFWRLAAGFSQGDIVQRFAPGTGGYSMSPFVGRVTAVHRGLGVVDCQFSYGNERLPADEIILVDPKISVWLPPEFDQSYDSYDIQKARSRQASVSGPLWKGPELPAGFYSEVAKAWSKGANEVGAYDAVWHRFAAQGIADDGLRSEVAKFYQVASRLTDLRIQQHVVKTAAYWVAQNRQYRVTQAEVQGKKPACPKCGTTMRRTTYKMDKGARMRLFACPKDLFLIKTDSILGPQGEPVGW
jgi:ribosomal protein S27AE